MAYAKEITTVEGGEGLDGLMSARRDSLYGILNGIDYEEYNPKIDPYIDTNFSRKDVFTGKEEKQGSSPEGVRTSAARRYFSGGHRITYDESERI